MSPPNDTLDTQLLTLEPPGGIEIAAVPADAAPQQLPAAKNSFPRKAPRYQTLDQWRGLACLTVVVFHASMQVATVHATSSGGVLGDAGLTVLQILARTWIGVPIFFVISGYCIMATLDSRRRKDNGLVDYFSRRFKRIFPPFWIALMISVLAIGVVEAWVSPGLFSGGIFTIPIPWEMSAWQWMGNLTLTETWRHWLGGGHTSMVLPNTWTLCYEEQFYAVAGLLLFLAPRRIFVAAAVTTAISIVVKVVAHRAGVSLEGFFFDGRWLLIAAGIMVYYRINYAKPWEAHLIHLLLLVGVVLADRNPRMLLEHMPNHGIERFIGFGFALLISLTYRWDARISAAQWLRPLAICGGMSYSIYLIHPLFTKAISHGLFRAGFDGPWQTLLVTIPLCLVVSLAASWCFHQLVERRFMSTPPPQTKVA